VNDVRRQRGDLANPATVSGALMEACHPAPVHQPVFLPGRGHTTLDFITRQPGRLAARRHPRLLSASPGTAAGKAFPAWHYRPLRLLTAHLRAYGKQLDRLPAAHPDAAIFASFPGSDRLSRPPCSARDRLGPRWVRPVGALLARSGHAGTGRPATAPRSRTTPPVRVQPVIQRPLPPAAS
jgi:hypothetical protein